MKSTVKYLLKLSFYLGFGITAGAQEASETLKELLRYDAMKPTLMEQFSTPSPTAKPKLLLIDPNQFHPPRGQDFYFQDDPNPGYLIFDEKKDSILEPGGGDWGSSGGDGVICFSSEVQAQSARDQIRKNGYVEENLVAKAESAYALEVYEYLKAQGNMSENDLLPDARVQSVIKKFEARFREYTPNVWYLMEELRSKHSSANWIPANLKDVPDSKPSVSNTDNGRTDATLIAGNCVLMQAVLRVSQRSINGHKPEAFFFYNPIVFHQKFSRFSRYIMELHEHFYFLLSTVGHRDSQKVRKAIIELVLGEKFNGQESDLSKRRHFGTVLWQVLGDYQLLWFQHVANGAQKNRHLEVAKYYDDYIKMVSRVRKTATDCRNSNEYKGLDKNEAALICQITAVEGTDYRDSMSDAEAFFFLTHFYLDYITQNMNAAHMGAFSRVNPAAANTRWLQDARNSCELLGDSYIVDPYYMSSTMLNFVPKALRFCENLF